MKHDAVDDVGADTEQPQEGIQHAVEGELNVTERRARDDVVGVVPG